MPELPEVESICSELSSVLLNKKISNIKIINPRLKEIIPQEIQNLNNSNIIKIYRIAKYIIFELDNDFSIISHMGMSGSWQIRENNNIEKHDCLLIHINNQMFMTYNDQRRFGLVSVVQSNLIKKHRLFKNLGIDPLHKKFDINYLYIMLTKNKSNIKFFLTNNKIITGIGNIYASEILFASRINPMRKACTISYQETQELHKSIISILKEAIKKRGTTISNYITPEGNKGIFQNELKVYNKFGKNCEICNALIKKITQGKRTTFYCETCQQ